MKYQFFAAAVLNAALVSQTNAWEHAYRWSSGVDQQTYDKHMRMYSWVAGKAIDFFEKRKVEKNQDPITDLPSAMNTILYCEACQGTFKLAQDLFRDSFMQQLIINLGSDVCWFGGQVITHDACALFVVQSAPTIMDSIASLIVSPEYSCEIELGYCNREWYKLD